MGGFSGVLELYTLRVADIPDGDRLRNGGFYCCTEVFRVEPTGVVAANVGHVCTDKDGGRSRFVYFDVGGMEGLERLMVPPRIGVRFEVEMPKSFYSQKDAIEVEFVRSVFPPGRVCVVPNYFGSCNASDISIGRSW